MILQYDLRCAIDRRPDSGKLNQDIRTGAALLDHALDRGDVTCRARELVDDGFGLLVFVRGVVMIAQYPIPLWGIGYHLLESIATFDGRSSFVAIANGVLVEDRAMKIGGVSGTGLA